MSAVPTWPNGKPRSMGGPFDILYAPRAVPTSAKPRGKPGPKLRRAVLRAPTNTAPNFNTPIPTKEQDAKTRQVRGRGLQ